MKFLFLDLEFNQSQRYRGDIAGGLHIIQCAYTITDENFKTILSRNIYIKYNLDKISPIVSELTGITESDLFKKGVSFNKCVQKFINDYKSVGYNDLNIIVWGNNDISVFKKNCILFGIEYRFLLKFRIFNLQQFFTFMKMPNNNPTSLKKAHDMISNKFQKSFFSENRHNATHDVEACISIAKSLDLDVMIRNHDRFKIQNDDLLSAREVSSKLKYKATVKNIYKCDKCSKFTKTLFKDPTCYNRLLYMIKFCDLRYCKHCDETFIRINLLDPDTKEIRKIKQTSVDLNNCNPTIRRNFYNYKNLKTLIEKGAFDEYIKHKKKPRK